MTAARCRGAQSPSTSRLLRRSAQATTLRAPVESEALAVPPDDGLRLDDDERLTPAGPDARENHPESAIKDGEPWTALVSSPQDAELMTEGQIL